ncbi:hypothetical protein KYI07_11905 (plasmid) [Macrococcus psychrotolerans]|uniref:Uncharacterized protein n=2 Tax=Staphylococcaceae TaxID=90964 RepID=A0A8F8LR34_9STAP|nr:MULTISPECIES: hypothetical protein [Macrococcus]QYA33993.1 hypothetical protein KYI10_11345 [Macrococcus sp. 19Msa1099]QYA38906.1 hypothetical protein KYI07_11905 [Macrococcus caseolyticus]QYA77504.1 hypothetical protein KYI12_11330 [Macrococcus caseolyticus]
MSLIDIERAIQIIRTNKADTEQVRRLGHSVGMKRLSFAQKDTEKREGE